MHRSLFAERPSPYYIMSPDYRRNSAGIRVLHMLCDALVRSGYEAYISSAVLNPRLMTPRLTNDVTALHKAQKVEPIIIYPEVVDGNPMGGNVVVRYLLNQPGFLRAISPFEEDDILFSYTRELLQPGMTQDRVLYMPAVDVSIFCPPTDPTQRIPGKVCYYQGRQGKALIDPALLAADSIEITPGSPGSWEELAAVFQQCEFFYCSEPSGLAAEAALCGCVAVVIPSQYAPRPLSNHENNSYGVAWGNTPQAIETARQTAPLLRQSLLKHQENFWTSLDHFIEVTQNAALTYATRPIKCQDAHWLAARQTNVVQRMLIDQHLEHSQAPVFGIFILDPDGALLPLNETLESLAQHNGLPVIFQPVVLTTADIACDNKRVFRFDPLDTVETLNRVIGEQACDVFIIVHAGETFTASGLLRAALELTATPDCRAIYADEVMRFEDGSLSLALRPDINLDLLLSFPASMARHWLLRRDVWQKMGGFTTEFPDAFELDFILRMIEASGLEGLGHMSEPLIVGDVLLLEDNVQERQVIERHLRARGFEASQVGSRLPGRYEVDYGHSIAPAVSILIVADGQLAHLQRCVDSLLENTRYGNYELLLLDRGNEETAMCTWLSGIEQLGIGHLRVLRFPASLSPEVIRNRAVSEARGEFLIFLDASIGVIVGDWLEQLLNHAMRPEVGGVGAKLIAGDGTIRHAGLLLGMGGTVASPFARMPGDSDGYMQRLQVDQNYSALSSQCLMVRQTLFAAAGGFDEDVAPWSDVDLCLKLQQAGYLNVWTPRVQMLIGESGSVDATPGQLDRLYQRWLPTLARDRAYNPNFSLANERAFRAGESSMSWQPLSTFTPIPTLLAHPAGEPDSARHRIIQPFNALRAAGVLEGALSSQTLSAVDVERYNPDVVVFQQYVRAEQLETMRQVKAFTRSFKVFDLDLYLPNLSAKSPHYRQLPPDVLGALRQGLSYMDRLVVSTDFMAQVFDGFNADIRIVNTRLDPLDWSGLQGARRRAEKPRVGWVGSLHSIAELEMLANVIKELANEVDWVILGACPAHLRSFIREYHDAVAIDEYPTKLASLNLDLALAPLEDNLFNRCKGNIRLLEFGACGVPVICSDIEAYRGDLPTKRVENRFEAWVDAIRAHVQDLDAAAALGDVLRARIHQDWMLDDAALASWRDSWLAH